MPASTSLFVDQVLSNVSIKYKNPEMSYISEELFPTVEVKQRTGIYFEYGKEDFEVVNDVRARGDEANTVDYELVQRTYGPLLDHSLQKKVPNEDVEESINPLDPMIDATENLTSRILINKEVAAATLMANTSIVTQYTTLSGDDQWSDFANSDPFGDVQTGRSTIKAATGITPNTLTMGQEVWDKLKFHPDLLERIKFMSGRQVAQVTLPDLALLLEVKRVIIADAMKKTSAEGQTDTLGYIWGKKVWLSYVTPKPGLRTVSGGYTLHMKQNGLGRTVERWYEDKVKSTFLRCSYYYQHKIMAANTIYYIAAAVA